MAESMYCPACGAQSPTNLSQRDGQDVTECTTCGLILDSSQARQYEPISEILFADDSDLLRVAIEDVLVDKRLAKSVLAANNGQEFLELFVQRLREGRPVDLVMLDVQMPVMNGFNAAIACRAVERGFELPKPTPMMFFSSQPCDETAKKVLQFCGRAIYVNKVASPNLGELANRVEQVLIDLLTKGTA
ncbi:MAG: response regulator [Acidobacteriota bacterium]